MTVAARVCRLYGANDIRVETDQITMPASGEVLVAIEHGGICGSDLHYYQDGGFGPVRIGQPIVLGHEAAGRIAAVGSGVGGLKPGDVVAVNPSKPCQACKFCDDGLFRHCLNMEFMGSALRFPHTQGVFREHLVVAAEQCVRFEKTTDTTLAACAEPLAVCLHARNRVGDLKGQKVLVTGAGPIGLLCTALAAASGVSDLVVTDIQNAPLDIARIVGARSAINVAQNPSRFSRYAEDKGYFDVVFECSAATGAIQSSMTAVRPCGTVVQVGVRGNAEVPINTLVGKEVNLIGSHRFHEEFADAARLIDDGAIDVRPVITHSFPMVHVRKALDIAGDRSVAAKVQIRFSDTL